MSAFRQKVAAARRGDHITLRLLREEQAQRIAFDLHAPLLDRVLAAAASGAMQPSVVEAMLRDTPELRAAVINMANAATGDVRIDMAAGRDVVTINVYVGGGT